VNILLLNDDQPRGMGYLEIDQRASGIPVSIGYGVRFEADTYTCTHCNAVVIMNPQRKRERYKCKGCQHHICDSCAAAAAAGAACLTMAQRFEEYLAMVETSAASGASVPIVST
jgi:hypothetical protein